MKDDGLEKVAMPERHTTSRAMGACTARLLLCLLSSLLGLPSSGVAFAKDDLTIGITQFPSTFHPNIDAMVAKSYILAMTERPFTAYDASWRLVCMLCTELPTFENGFAKREKTPQGKDGVALTYKIQPGATWGDGYPGHEHGRALHLEGRARAQERGRRPRALPPHPQDRYR